MFLKLVGALALTLMVVGCTTQSRQKSFADVKKISDPRITWRMSSDEDRDADRAVASLVARPLNENSVVAVALLNNHSLQAEYESLAISQADLVQAGLLRNPVFSASARVPDRSPRGTDVELSITQSFLDLILIPSRRQIASEELEATKFRVADAVIELATQTKSAYVRVQADERILDLQKQAVETLALAAKTAQRLHDVGNLNDLDWHDREATYQQAALDLTATETSIAAEREQLYTLLGVSTKIEIEHVVPEIPPREATTQPSETDAIEHRLDAQASRRQINAIARTLGLREQTRWFSDVQIGADAERQTDKQWIVGPTLSIPIPLFDQGQASNAKAQAELRQARQKYLALVAQIKSEVRLATLKVSDARSRCERFQSTLLPLRQELLDESQRQYNGMLQSPFDLLKRKQEQLDAQREAIEAIRDYWLARIELDRARGIVEPPMDADERR